MIKNFIFLCLSFIVCLPLAAQNQELPLTWHDGYGPFELLGVGLGLQSEETEKSSWESAEPKLKGIPTDWKDTQIGYIDTDRYPLESDTTRLSKTPMRCEIGLAIGKGTDGQTWMVVDRNNNGDLSDDTPFIPIRVEDYVKDRNGALKHAFPVTYDKLQDGKITEARVLLLVFDAGNGIYAFNFAQYATARLGGRLIGIHGRGIDVGYRHTEIAWMHGDDGVLKERVGWTEAIGMNEYLNMDGVCYKNQGVDLNKNVLLLQRMEVPADQLLSTQVGFRAIDFAGVDHKTKAGLSLESYRGKYVFLEFWSQTCGSCLREMPNIKNLYERADKDKVEFIGIIGDSSARTIDKLMEKYDISWPQLLCDATNPVKKDYGIFGYPTTFLINPDGVIIGKNLRLQELEETLMEIGVIK